MNFYRTTSTPNRVLLAALPTNQPLRTALIAAAFVAIITLTACAETNDQPATEPAATAAPLIEATSTPQPIAEPESTTAPEQTATQTPADTSAAAATKAPLTTPDPTATSAPVPTASPTNAPAAPTATTDPPTTSTATPIPPTASAQSSPIPPTVPATSAAPLVPSPTPTSVPVGPTATTTAASVPTATPTPAPVEPTATPGLVINQQLADEGSILYNSNCSGCHSRGSDTKVGPGHQNVYETAKSRVPVIPPEAYLSQSITDSTAFVVPGFSPIMPSFTNFSDDQILALIEYLKTL